MANATADMEQLASTVATLREQLASKEAEVERLNIVSTRLGNLLENADNIIWDLHSKLDACNQTLDTEMEQKLQNTKKMTELIEEMKRGEKPGTEQLQNALTMLQRTSEQARRVMRPPPPNRLPYGGNMQAAMQAQDRNAIRVLMDARRSGNSPRTVRQGAAEMTAENEQQWNAAGFTRMRDPGESGGGGGAAAAARAYNAAAAELEDTHAGPGEGIPRCR